MGYTSLTPATQAVLDALTELGQGNVHELADKSGKARSTTDKALKTLADLKLIVPVDTDADPAEGVPTRWTLAEGTDSTPDEIDGPDPAAPGDDEPYYDGDDTGADLAAGTDEPDNDPDPADLPDDIDPFEIRGEPATYDDQIADEGGLDEPSDGDAGQDEQPDTADDTGEQSETGDAADTGPDSGTGQSGEVVDPDSENTPTALPVAVVPAARPGDRKVMAIKGVLADCGEDGATMAVIVAESGIGTGDRHPAAHRDGTGRRRPPSPRPARTVDHRPDQGVRGGPEPGAAPLPGVLPDRQGVGDHPGRDGGDPAAGAGRRNPSRGRSGR